jgi:hypothetical protein
MVQSNKFFQTNVDFAAPIKAMQQKPQIGDNLSQDSEDAAGYLPAGVHP